jgi:hypothetical protein
MHMPDKQTTAKKDTAGDMKDMPASDSAMHMDGHKGMHMGNMCSAYSPDLPMSRDGSGTAWEPDAAPKYGIMIHSHQWMWMFMGNIFPRYNVQDIGNKGSRGGSQFDAPDMLMAMGQRKVGAQGLFHFNIMMSTDAPITGGNGYPLLFQTGESWHGVPLVDRQHPHDLFSELSVSYAHSFSSKAGLFGYLGYPGEPALGPVTFMHRASGEFMPDAPIGHHWADATHITFGVATLGVRYGQFKLEGSSFTGREPDENRYNFDTPKFDSRSVRLSFNPSANWSFQVSTAFIKSPEALRPEENVYRTTASGSYVYPLSNKKYIAATALWGQNQVPGQTASNAALLEGTLKLNRLALYTRFEWVQKSVEELDLQSATFQVPDYLFPLDAFTIGGAYDLFSVGAFKVAGGLQGTLYHAPSALTFLYGSDPFGAEVYLHIYPHRM